MTEPLWRLLSADLTKLPKEVRRPVMIRCRQLLFKAAALTSCEVFPSLLTRVELIHAEVCKRQATDLRLVHEAAMAAQLESGVVPVSLASLAHIARMLSFGPVWCVAGCVFTRAHNTRCLPLLTISYARLT